MKYLLFLIIMLFFTAGTYGELVKQTVEYKDGDKILEGYLVYDDAGNQKRPGVMLIHEWWGLNSYIMGRADEIARLGYVAFAADIYGKGIRAKDMAEAGKLSRTYSSDRELIVRRANEGLDQLKNNSLVDQKRIAVMGYCFGGGVALELARSGADVTGVVTFHGSLASSHPEDDINIKGKVLVLHGADDPFVNAKIVNEFEDSMRKTRVDWQVVLYSGAVHGFTNPDNGNDPSKGLAYNERADKRSWEAMKAFYNEIFQQAE